MGTIFGMGRFMPPATPMRSPFGAEMRSNLFPGESEFFRSNPNVAGMAADDNKIVLNPFSALSEQEKQAVSLNEAARIFMRRNNTAPRFEITDEQRQQFQGTIYDGNDPALRATIAARIFSGDPSALNATPEQKAFAMSLLGVRLMQQEDDL